MSKQPTGARCVLLQSAVALCVALSACGDDESPADAGTDSSDDGSSGSGGSTPRAGTGGRGGSSGNSGRGGGGGRAGTGGQGGQAAGPTGTPVTIRFAAKIGDQSLDCTSEYPAQGSTRVRARVQDLRMFVQSVSLIDKSGREVPVQFDDRAPFQTPEVALLDFTERMGACLTGGGTINNTITGTVPEGDYEGVVFVNGVPESENHENIATQKPPLQDPSTFWGWQMGYRFIVAEILPTSLPDEDAGTTEVGTATFVHIGSAGCTGNNTMGFTCSRPNRNRVELDGFDPKTDSIVVDLGKVFAEVDLAQAVECHGPGPECMPMYDAFGVDLPTGSASTTQTVFRVE